MAELTPEQQLVAQIESKFGSLDIFYVWLDGAAALMERSKIENELHGLQDKQQASRQEIEVGIQARQAEFDLEIKALRDTQQADFDKWQAQVDEKQSQLDALNAMLKG